MDLPKYIEIETSRFCNRRCHWCPNSVLKDRTTQELMEWSAFQKVVHSLASRNYQGWLAFHNYNEPLANPRLIEELRFARRNLAGARLTVYTNGDFLTDVLFTLLKSAGLSQMRITRYPQDGEVGEPSCKALWDWVKSKAFLDLGSWKEALLRQGPALVNEGPPELLLISPRIGQYYDRGGILPFLSAEHRKTPCFLTSNSLSIDFKGNIKMCCNVTAAHAAHSPYIWGNINDDDPVAVWNSAQFNSCRARHTKSDWSETPICRTCRQEISIRET